MDIDLALASCSAEERKATYLACWVVAFCDGRLWRETEVVKQIAKELQLGRKDARRIEWAARRGKKSFVPPESEAGRRVMFHFTLKVAAADGRLDEQEVRFARQFGTCLGLSNRAIDAELQASMPKHDRPEVRRAHGSSEAGLPAAQGALALAEGMRAGAAQAAVGDRFREYVVPFVLTVIANLVPVCGALFWGWNAVTILLTYWIETIVVALFCVLKMRRCEQAMTSVQETVRGASLLYVLWIGFHGFVVLLFCYGLLEQAELTAEQMFFLVLGQLGSVLLAVLLIMAQQSYAYFVDFIRPETYKRTKPLTLLGGHYPGSSPCK